MKDLQAHNQKLLDKIVDSSYPTSTRFHDKTGKTYGRLKVDHYVGKDKNGNMFYDCICECGNEIIVQYGSLSSGVTTSCGCAHADIMREKKTTHGLRHHPLYITWQNMIERCRNPRDNHYYLYGARGIKVCDEWAAYNPNGFKNFYDWSIANGWYYSKEIKNKVTIDRINGNKDYCPENCRWVSYKVQGNNTSRNHCLQLDKYIFTITLWSEITGISDEILRRRKKNGWTDEETLLTPKGSNIPNKNIILQIPEEYSIYNLYNTYSDKGILKE